MCWVSQLCRVDGQGRYMKVGDFIFFCHPPFKGKKSRYTTSKPFKFSWTEIFFNGFCCSSWCAVFFQLTSGICRAQSWRNIQLYINFCAKKIRVLWMHWLPFSRRQCGRPNAINFVAALILMPWVGEIGILHDRNHHWLHHLNRFLVKAPWCLGCGTLAKFCSKWMWLHNGNAKDLMLEWVWVKLIVPKEWIGWMSWKSASLWVPQGWSIHGWWFRGHPSFGSDCIGLPHATHVEGDHS